jgi:hypothetical protein
MSSADKTKLDGIATGANNYAHPATHPASIITQDSMNRFVTDADKATWNGKASTSVVTTGTNGLMSAADKTKLDGVASGANNYSHPTNHPPSIITQDANNRFVTDTEKSTWNGKQATLGFTPKNVAKKGVSNGYADLDANAKIPDARISSTFVTQSQLGTAGYGDMTKAAYDSDGDGKVNSAMIADSAPWSGVTGKPSTFPPSTHNHDDMYYTESEVDLKLDQKVTISNSALPYVSNFVVYGDSDKYYPVILGGGDQNLLRTIKIWRGYADQAPNDWYSDTHKGSLMLHWMGNFGGWGGAAYSEFIYENTSQYTLLLADCYLAVHNMGYCFMLRGGSVTGARYFIASDQPIRGQKNTNSGAVDIWYGGSTERIFENTQGGINYDVYAPNPVTVVNTAKLKNIKVAKSAVATSSIEGLMSTSDKTKLDGIATGANNYSHPASIITQDASNRFVSDVDKANWNGSMVIRWQNQAKVSTWSRLLFLNNGTVEGHSFIITISGTRGSVVYNSTFHVKASHNSKCNIEEINSSSYGSNLLIRGVVNDGGDAYIEVFDDNLGTAGSTQAINISLVKIRSTTITTYTAFSDGTTIPPTYIEAGKIRSSVGNQPRQYVGTLAPRDPKQNMIWIDLN